MIDQPRLERRSERHYAGIPVRVTLAEWYKANALVPEIYQWLALGGLQPRSGPIYRYRTIGDHDREFDLEVGVSVDSPVIPDGRIVAGALPAGRYAVMVHHGHPDRQVQSHQALQAWVVQQGLRFAKTGDGPDEVWAARYETYLTDPVEQPDPEQWSTELAYLIAEGP